MEERAKIDRTKVAREAVRARATALLHEIAKIPVGEISEEASFDTTLQLESMQLVELQVALEHEFGVELDPLHMIELNRFGAIVDYIHERATLAQGEEE